MEIVTGLLSSFGLSSAAGLNAYLPLLVVGLLQRFGVLDFPDSYALLSSTWVLVGIAVLGALDFVGDKIPGIDHALHVFGGVVNAVAGAVLFAANTGLTSLSPGVSLLLGFAAAASVQLGRAALRPVSTSLTGGVGNPVVSAAEDGTSLGLTLSALFAPLLAGLLMLGLLIGGWWVWQRRPGQQARS